MIFAEEQLARAACEMRLARLHASAWAMQLHNLFALFCPAFQTFLL